VRVWKRNLSSGETSWIAHRDTAGTVKAAPPSIDVDLAGVTLIPGGGGQVGSRIGDELVFSNATAGRFPEMRELRELVAARLDNPPPPAMRTPVPGRAF
jgi:predicted Rdx family selenoprotein